MANDVNMLEYQPAAKASPKEPRWVLRRLVAGLVELLLTFIVLGLVGACGDAFGRRTSAGSYVAPGIAAIGSAMLLFGETLDQNCGRLLGRLIVVYPDKTWLRRVLRAVLLRPILLLLPVMWVLDEPAIFVLSLPFYAVDVIGFIFTRLRIADHVTGAREVPIDGGSG